MSLSGRLFREFGKHVPAGLAKLAGRPAAVLFHGVEFTTDDARVQTNHHERDDFRAIARSLKAHFDVLPLDALDDVLKQPEKHSRALFLMSDDGYANTLTIAADILEEMALPWTLFVSTHHIDTRERNPAFLARLFAFYAPAGAYRLPNLKDVVVLSDNGGFRDLAAQRLISLLKTLNGPEAKQTIGAMVQSFSPTRFDELLARFQTEEFLTWDGVRELRKRGVTIGAHANWHWPMNAAQSPDNLRDEARLSKQRIEAKVGPCRYFAYPFGNTEDVSRGAWHAVRDAGYAYGFTTLAGSLDARMNPYLLPRYGLAQRETNAASLIALLRAGNGRVLEWQKTVAA